MRLNIQVFSGLSFSPMSRSLLHVYNLKIKAVNTQPRCHDEAVTVTGGDNASANVLTPQRVFATADSSSF